MNIDVEKLAGRVNLLPHRMLLDGDPLTFENAEQANAHLLVEALFTLPDVQKITVGQDYISLFYPDGKDTAPLIKQAISVLEEHLPPLQEQQGGDGMLPLLAIDTGLLIYLGLA